MGRAVVSNSSLQLLLKQAPSATDVVAQTFKLTDEEAKRLSQFPIGEGLFFAGLNHIIIRILASATESQLITTNPQQLADQRAALQSRPTATPEPSVDAPPPQIGPEPPTDQEAPAETPRSEPQPIPPAQPATQAPQKPAEPQPIPNANEIS